MAEGRSFNPGDVIAEKYELQRPLAKGGMGAVWVAQNQMTERRVAIKFVLPELAQSPDTIQRFFREAKASARIDHPSIVDVLDLGTLEDGAPFLVMEYLEGRSLEAIIDAEPLAPIQIAAVMLDVTRALSAAHAAGIVHRDLKPGNIVLAKKGDQVVPKILDFGISKITAGIGDVRMTRTGAVLGSPAYMSPEQARGRSDIDGRADIWAVGVILYEAVSGKLPFNGENYNQVMMAITLDPPVPLTTAAPSVDAEFLAIVEACLQKDRELRPASMDVVASMIDGYVAPRAAYGIPPIDVGDGDPKRATSQRAGYAIPRAVVSHRPPPPTREGDPAHPTMGAVTLVHNPQRSRKNVVALGVGAALVLAGASFGAWAVMGKARSKPAASTSIVVPATQSAPAAPSPSPAPVVVAPSAVEPAVSASPSVSASASASASATVPAKKPPVLAPKPKPKGSTDEGPANVGPGPGF